MPILVVYASKHGATREIAERIAQTMAAAGQQAQARPATAAVDLTGYDAFVVGSAVYMAHWRKERWSSSGATGLSWPTAPCGYSAADR